jgi:hypothetical protein
MNLVYGWVYGWLAILVLVCVAGPYLLGLRPRRRLEWRAMTATVAFLVWLLGGFVSLRS